MSKTVRLTPEHILQQTRHKDINIQTCMLKAGWSLRKTTKQAVAANRNIPSKLWIELYRNTEETSIKEKLVDRHLNREARQTVVENETESRTLHTFINKNRLTQNETQKLLTLQRPNITLELGRKGAHNQTSREQMREALYTVLHTKPNSTQATIGALTLGALNMEEHAQNLKKPSSQLESATKQNIERTFKLVNTLTARRKTLKENSTEQNHIAVLLSSTPIYMQNLHLLDVTVHNRETTLKILSRSMLNQQAGDFIKKHLTKTNRKTVTETEAILENNPSWHTKPLDQQTLSQRLYNATDTEEIELLFYETQKGWVRGNKTHIASTLFARNLLENHTETTNNIKEQYLKEHYPPAFEQMSLNFAWGTFQETEPYRTYRKNSTENIRRKQVEQVSRKASQTLQNSVEAWMYWLGIGWDTVEEAERNLDLAVNLTKTEKPK